MTPVGLLDEYAGLYAAQSPEPPQKGGDALYEQVLEFSHRLQLNLQGVSVFPGSSTSRERSPCVSALRSSRPLLLLLLHSFYLSPYQVSCFSQHRDCSTLLWVVQFHHVLHLSDALKCACQPLRRA